MGADQVGANILLAIIAVSLLLLSVKRAFCSNTYTIESATARKWMRVVGFAAAIIPMFNLVMTAILG